MTKNDKVFIALLIISVALITAVMDQNLSAQSTAPATAEQVVVETTSAPYDPARTESVRKEFEAMGLQPHEGKYWKP